eukprot:scaffold2090_cov225-Prasinococcus_capsulatus_cf.AAC.6
MQQQYPPPPQYYPHAPALASPTPMDVPVLDGYEFVREIRPRASFGQAAQVENTALGCMRPVEWKLSSC